MQKLKSFRPWQPEQTTLLPPSPSDWLSDDHQVYFLLDLVNELDLAAILIPAQAKDPRGEKGFDPRMMTMLLLYGYCVGIVSSRRIKRACYENLAFRVRRRLDRRRLHSWHRAIRQGFGEVAYHILTSSALGGMVMNPCMP